MVSPGTELVRRMATGDRDALAPSYDLCAPRRPEHRSSRGLNRLLDRGLRGAPKGGLRMSDFVSDVAAIRRRARQHIEKGPVTGGYKADLPRVIEVLNEVLATEIVCVLRYKRHYFTAAGINPQPVAQEFTQPANEHQQHAAGGAHARRGRGRVGGASPPRGVEGARRGGRAGGGEVRLSPPRRAPGPPPALRRRARRREPGEPPRALPDRGGPTRLLAERLQRVH